MVDFKALSRMDPAEIAARDAAAREAFYAREEAERDGATTTRLAMTLVQEPEMRSLPSGDRVVLLRGRQDDKEAPSVAVYRIPSRTSESEDREAALDTTLRSLGGGDRVSLAGKWSKRVWKDGRGESRSAWEFKTQVFEKGEVSLERMMENERASRLGVSSSPVPAPGVDAPSAVPVRRPRGPSPAAGMHAGTGR